MVGRGVCEQDQIQKYEILGAQNGGVAQRGGSSLGRPGDAGDTSSSHHPRSKSWISLLWKLMVTWGCPFSDPAVL